MSERAVNEPAAYPRALAYHGVEYLLRTLRNLGPAFDFDYERMVIALSVTMGNIQHIIQSPEQLEPFSDVRTIIPSELQRPVSRLSITRATGLPRETVRRKIAAMIEAGLLVKDERGGVRLTPGALNSERLAGAVMQHDADLRRLLRLAGSHISGTE